MYKKNNFHFGKICIDCQLKSDLRWAGHVSRVNDYRLPKMVLYGELSTGHCDRGVLKRLHINSLNKCLNTCHIDLASGILWVPTTAFGTTSSTRLPPLLRIIAKPIERKKSRKKKYWKASAVIPDVTFYYSLCGRPCLSRIDLASHEHACSILGNPLL